MSQACDNGQTLVPLKVPDVDRRETLLKALSALSDDEILDVTAIDCLLCLFRVREATELSDFKYLLADHRVMANTYSSIAEAASMLPRSTDGEDSVIWSVAVVDSSIRLKRISPRADYDIPSESSQNTKYQNSRHGDKSSCIARTDRLVVLPKWIERLETVDRPKSQPSGIHVPPRLILRMSDMPSIESVFNL